MRERVDLKSPVREYRPPGSVRGAPGNRRPYLDNIGGVGMINSWIYLSRQHFLKSAPKVGGPKGQKLHRSGVSFGGVANDSTSERSGPGCSAAVKDGGNSGEVGNVPFGWATWAGSGLAPGAG